MKIVGLTGGIGSGKSTISKILLKNEIPVYNSDKKAKLIMEENEELKIKIKSMFGDQCFINGKLNKKHLSKLVFGDLENNMKMNSIVHPFVHSDFIKWTKKFKKKYVVYESALIFETGSYKKNDFNVLVVSDENKRINRVMLRDKCSENQVRKKMKFQLNDLNKTNLCDYLIYNHDFEQTKKDVYKMINFLNRKFHCLT